MQALSLMLIIDASTLPCVATIFIQPDFVTIVGGIQSIVYEHPW